jgi:hypothetical protein
MKYVTDRLPFVGEKESMIRIATTHFDFSHTHFVFTVALGTIRKSIQGR